MGHAARSPAADAASGSGPFRASYGWRANLRAYFKLRFSPSGHDNTNRDKRATEDEARFFQFDCCCRLPGRRVRNVFDDRDEPVSRQMHDDRGEFDVVRGRFRREWPVDCDGGT